MKTYITTEQLLEKIPFHRVHLMRLVKSGKVPLPRKPGGGKLLWVQEEWDAWDADQAKSAKAEFTDAEV